MKNRRTWRDSLRLGAVPVVFMVLGAEPVLARSKNLTLPGRENVRICLERFVKVQRTNPRAAEAILIHESLHSLGLAENPPPVGPSRPGC